LFNYSQAQKREISIRIWGQQLSKTYLVDGSIQAILSEVLSLRF